MDGMTINTSEMEMITNQKDSLCILPTFRLTKEVS
jgi:hypothetical protein